MTQHLVALSAVLEQRLLPMRLQPICRSSRPTGAPCATLLHRLRLLDELRALLRDFACSFDMVACRLLCAASEAVCMCTCTLAGCTWTDLASELVLRRACHEVLTVSPVNLCHVVMLPSVASLRATEACSQ